MLVSPLIKHGSRKDVGMVDSGLPWPIHCVLSGSKRLHVCCHRLTIAVGPLQELSRYPFSMLVVPLIINGSRKYFGMVSSGLPCPIICVMYGGHRVAVH